MHLVKRIHVWGRAAVVLALLLVLGGAHVEEAQAQWIPKWLNVGDFQNDYLSSVAKTEADESNWHYPGIRPRTAFGRWRGLWISAENVTDEDGRMWPVRVSHSGVRVTGVGEVFSVSHTLTSRYEQPTVQVDGADTFAEPTVVDEVDPGLAPDRMVTTVSNFSIGVTVERKAMQWSHPDHENYHVVEYTFTNTGNVDDDDEIEVEQSLENVYFTFLERTTGGAVFSGAWDNSAGGVAWGQYTMNDAVGDGVSDYGVDFRAQFSWLGNVKETAGLDLNTLGNPMWADHQWRAIADDTLGRLGAATFTGQVTIHADAEAHAEGASSPDDPQQPSTMTFLNNDFGDITSGSNHTDEPKMAKERKWIECGSTLTVGGGVPGYEEADNCTPGPGGTGRTWPTHARLIMGQTADAAHDSDPDFANQTADPTRGAGAGGWSWMTSYGPYDMEPGEQVKIVHAAGVAGLSPEAQFRIGRDYKLSGYDDEMLHGWNPSTNASCEEGDEGCVLLTKNEWVMTARDSLFQMFQRAIDNYQGGLNAPHPPPPPTSFTVTSGTEQINLEWTASSEPAGGWEIWRARRHYSGIITAFSVGADGIAVPDMARQYVKIDEVPGGTTSYADTDVAPAGQYFYYLQAVGADGTKSNRYYAQTYTPATLKEPPGSLSQVRIVPNPYHLGSAPEVRPDGRDRLVFFGLPAQARIEIYTELGELVDTIEHTDGSGLDTWDSTTSSRQLVVSGIYIAVITDLETGENIIQKFIIIR